MESTAELAICAVCYLLASCLKMTKLDNKWLPLICGVLGGGLGILGFFQIPNFPIGDLTSAFSAGITSGLAATGANQVIKQLKGGECH